MCDIYWEIYEMGIPVVLGPALLAKALGCPTRCECDVVIHMDDLERVGSRDCVWTIEDPSFIHRHIWVGGYPHISLEDMAKIKGPSDVVECLLSRL